MKVKYALCLSLLMGNALGVGCQQEEPPEPAQTEKSIEKKLPEPQETPWFLGKWSGGGSLHSIAPEQSDLRWGKIEDAPAIAGAPPWEVKLEFFAGPDGRISGTLRAAKSYPLIGTVDDQTFRVRVRGEELSGALVLRGDDKKEDLAGLLRVSLVEEREGKASHRAFVGSVHVGKAE